MTGVDVKLPLQIAALDASVGREARLRGSPRQGSECAPKPPFLREREIGFTAPRPLQTLALTENPRRRPWPARSQSSRVVFRKSANGMIINASTTGHYLRFSSTVARHSRPAHAAQRTKGMKYLATCAKAWSYLAATPTQRRVPSTTCRTRRAASSAIARIVPDLRVEAKSRPAK
jgi:hypothetical protein